MTVTLAQVQDAARRIKGHVVKTPMLPDDVLSRRLAQPVWLKCEYLQTTGSFKLRGATNALVSLPSDTLVRGVITASTGNHGRALAHAAGKLGVPVTVCLSRLVPANKVQAIRDLGAEIRVVGASQDEAMAEVARAVAEEGMTEIPPFDHPDVVAGQGTLAPEMLAECPDAGTLLVPLSGGGLAAGIAVAAKTLVPGLRVVGVSMEKGAAMAASLRAGHPVDVVEEVTLADSLGGGIGIENRVTFDLCRSLLDDTILVTEAEIALAMRHLGQAAHVVEGAAAVGHAALISGRLSPDGPVIALLSGGNIDPSQHARIMAGANAVGPA